MMNDIESRGPSSVGLPQYPILWLEPEVQLCEPRIVSSPWSTRA